MICLLLILVRTKWKCERRNKNSNLHIKHKINDKHLIHRSLLMQMKTSWISRHNQGWTSEYKQAVKCWVDNSQMNIYSIENKFNILLQHLIKQ